MRVLSEGEMIGSNLHRGRHHIRINADHYPHAWRVLDEFAMIPEEARQNLMDHELAFIIFDDAESAKALYDLIDREFSRTAYTTVRVSLFNETEGVSEFQQMRGYDRDYSAPEDMA